MHNSVFGEIAIIVAIGMGVSLVMRLLRQPLIIGHILTGILVGPSVLNFISSGETIQVFSSLGIALLLFVIGLGLNPQVITEIGGVAGIVGLAQVALTTVAGYITGEAFGLSGTESLIVGLAVAFSSTIIILKLLSDKKEQGRLYGKITIGILLVQDVLASLALLVLTARNSGDGLSFATFANLTGKAMVIIGVLLFITMFILPKLQSFIAGSQEMLFLFAIGWAFGIAALFDRIGISLEVGALFAGVALAPLPYSQEIASRLRPLRDFFVVVFFVTLGANLNLDQVRAVLPFTLALTAVVLVVKPLLILLTMGALGYTKRTSFRAAMTIGQISEFSLVFLVLAVSENLAKPTTAAAITLVALISIAISSYLIIYSDGLYRILEPHLHMFERKKVVLEQDHTRHYDIIQFGYAKGGAELAKMFRDLKGHSFAIVDYDPEVIDTLEERKFHFMYGDATDTELLDEVGVAHAKMVVSTMTDHDTNKFLVQHMSNVNDQAVIICHADTATQATELYELGASYVMMPHYIGSERMSNFIHNHGLKKLEFKKFRQKHLQYLQSHYEFANDDA